MSPDADANKTFDVPSDSLLYCSPLSRKTHMGACHFIARECISKHIIQNYRYMCTTEVPTMNKQIFDKFSFLITSLKKHTIKIYPSNLKTKVKKKYK